MAILVVCPGCKKSFQVSDKYAGKSGPCPQCKGIIQIPTKSQEVKVHTPEQFASGGRTVSGKLALKPIARRKFKLQPVTAAIVAGSAAGMLLLAWLGRWIGIFGAEGFQILGTSLGLLAVSPALVFAAYTFLQNDEKEPYVGRQLYLRTAYCSLGYVALWGFFAWFVYNGLLGDFWMWLGIVPLLMMIGALAPTAALDLNYSDGFFHYSFYVIVTIVLGKAAGLPWPWDILVIPGVS